MKVTLFDLFLAGSETTSTTLTWAALYMVRCGKNHTTTITWDILTGGRSLLSTLIITRYPWIQAKVQEELDRVVGGDRCPGLADRARLPYTEAVLMEVQRHAHVLPLGVRHRSAGAQF